VVLETPVTNITRATSETLSVLFHKEATSKLSLMTQKTIVAGTRKMQVNPLKPVAKAIARAASDAQVIPKELYAKELTNDVIPNNTSPIAITVITANACSRRCSFSSMSRGFSMCAARRPIASIPASAKRQTTDITPMKTITAAIALSLSTEKTLIRSGTATAPTTDQTKIDAARCLPVLATPTRNSCTG